MKILDRYTVRQLIGPLIWCFCLFLVLYLVIDLFGHLDEILRFKVPLRILAKYYGAMIPVIFVQVAPFACLMAVLYTVGNLNKNQELVAMRASGLGPWQIVRPLLAAGLLVSGLVLYANEQLTPGAVLTLQILKDDYLERPPDPTRPPREQRPIESLAVYGTGHTLLYAKSFDPRSKVLEDVIILEHGPDLKLKRKITAARAEWTGSSWRFFNCAVLRFDSEGKSFGKKIGFERKIIPIGESPEILMKADQQSQAMSFRELKKYIERMGPSGAEATQKLQVELQTKLAYPFASFVIILIGTPLAVRSSRGGTLMGMGTAIGIALAFYTAQAIFTAAGKGGMLPPALAAWGANLIFGGLGILLLRRRLA
ncbi:MAG: LptF/LptG family permease [Candidatus Omnitrophica bacterium]|nr:LptF/LptG family permease [Candidatus Omnitrophota bacterium]